MLGDLKLHGSLGFLLHDSRPHGDAIPVGNIANAQLHQITRPELAVDGDIEQGEFSSSLAQPQSNPDRLDLLELERRFLPYELTFVPRLVTRRRVGEQVHEWSPSSMNAGLECATSVNAQSERKRSLTRLRFAGARFIRGARVRRYGLHLRSFLTRI